MRTHATHLVLVLAGISLLAGTAWAAEPVNVSVCGAVVGERQVGILTADLDCGTLTGVVLKNRARLYMNTHRILSAGDAIRGELEDGRISVYGPGEISACTNAIYATGSDVDAKRRVFVSDVSIDGCSSGVSGSTIRIDDSQVENGYSGFYADFRISGQNVVSRNHTTYGIVVPYGRVRMRDLTVTGNGWQGVLSPKVVLRDSSVTGNDAAFYGIDIGTTFAPRLNNVTCGRSAQEPFMAHVDGPPWGVCAND